MIVGVIGLARIYPTLGADYLKPKITATWIAVVIIFVLSGLGLKTEEFSKAFGRMRYNALLQVFNFGVVSAVSFALSRLIVEFNVLNEALADGIVICGCLPMAINIVIVLSASTGADEAAAVFNSTLGNIIGIFLSPLLILGYLGTSGDISLGEVFYKLTLRVVVPLIFGQMVQKFSTAVRETFRKYKRQFKKVQELCLVFIVYTVFCRTFEADAGAGLPDVFLMIFFQLVLMLSLMGVSWLSLRQLYRDQPKLRVTGLFAMVMKTVALGIPLINSMYEGDSREGLYSLPILIWHPMQLIIGSLLVPKLTHLIESETERLEREDAITDAAETPDIEEDSSSLDA